MFKCLCGGGNINNDTNNDFTNNAPSINNLPKGTPPKKGSRSPKKFNHINKSSLHPQQATSNTAMTKIQSSSNQTTPSPAHRHINGLNKQNKHIITASETENDEAAIISASTAHKKGSTRPKHVRKRTHPYKSRGDPHRNSSASVIISPIASPAAATCNISDYFVYDNFEFSIETFDFNLHYKFLIELGIKCLDMGPEVLSPSIFYKHNDIVCCVAVLHENNHKMVPTAYQKTAINNVVGFCICYPHANCRPYPDSVWMIGWLCADHHRIRSYSSQYLVIEALIRSSYCAINPKPVSVLPKISSALKAHLRETRDTKLYLNLHPIHQEEEEEDRKEDDALKLRASHKKKKKRRDKGIGIYAPYHHKKAQQLYEALGFEKIAKIANYYSTDREFLDEFYSEDKEKKVTKKLSTDAYLYCRGELAHCRLLLGMEYFNYKKWPKSAAQQLKEAEEKQNEELKLKQSEDEKKKETKSAKDVDKTDSKTKDRKKRHHGPKILEEYLQERIAKYHAKQNEQLLRSKQQQQNKFNNKLASQQNATAVSANPTNSAATMHAAHNRSTNHSSQKLHKSADLPRDKRREAQLTITQSHPNARHNSRHANTSAHRSSGGIHVTHQQQQQQYQNYAAHHQQKQQVHRSSGNNAALYDKRIRYKHANTHNAHRSSGGAGANSNQIAAAYYDDNDNNPSLPTLNGALSPNINATHRSNIGSSDGGAAGGKTGSSRHSSIANSQISHHYHATHNSGHSAHYYHYQRPTFTQSSNAGSSGGQRSSVTPTPTYGDATHSQAMYHPYLSNVSTATYTHSLAEDHGQHASLPRGNSYYSMASSHHSGANSVHSNASLRGDHPYNHHASNSYHHQTPHHTHYMHPSHQSHQSHHSAHAHAQHHHAHTAHDYGGAHSARGGSGAHHQHHDSYNDDPYNHRHKARNKRYTRSSRHSHKKLPQ